MLLKDLDDPFQGSFCINTSAIQLRSFEKLLMDDIAHAKDDAHHSGPTLLSLDRSSERPSYNTGNTVYLHLLTGPLGANIRLLGDVFSWAYQRITRGWWALKRKMIRGRPNKQGRKAQDGPKLR